MHIKRQNFLSECRDMGNKTNRADSSPFNLSIKTLVVKASSVPPEGTPTIVLTFLYLSAKSKDAPVIIKGLVASGRET